MFSGVKNWLGGWFGGSVQSGAHRPRQLLREIEAAAPVLESLGYRLVRLSVGIGRRQYIGVVLRREGRTPAAQLVDSLAKHSDQRALCLLLLAIQQATAAGDGGGGAGSGPTEVEIDLTFPPAVRLVYTPEGVGEYGGRAVPSPACTPPAPSDETTTVSPLSESDVRKARGGAVVKFRCGGCLKRYRSFRCRSGRLFTCTKCRARLQIP